MNGNGNKKVNYDDDSEENEDDEDDEDDGDNDFDYEDDVHNDYGIPFFGPPGFESDDDGDDDDESYVLDEVLEDLLEHHDEIDFTDALHDMLTDPEEGVSYRAPLMESWNRIVIY
jgi:hypothetical protein